MNLNKHPPPPLISESRLRGAAEEEAAERERPNTRKADRSTTSEDMPEKGKEAAQTPLCNPQNTPGSSLSLFACYSPVL